MYYLVMCGNFSSPVRFPKAAVVNANFAQFSAGQVFKVQCVKSRMVLWCKAGTGSVSVGPNVYAMESGCCLFLPWAHQIRYKASLDDPFLLGGVHIIPEHDTDKAITFTVPHDEQNPLASVSFRRDIAILELSEVMLRSLDFSSPLAHLLEYIVRLFIQSNPEEWIARQLAQQLLSEWLCFEHRGQTHDSGIPLELARMKQYIDTHLHRLLSLQDLVEFSQLSASTVGRMFRKHLNTTPVSWIIRIKIERAKILLRSRRMSVGQIGHEVGIPDPYYFSKCFKKETGFSPQEYKKQGVWI